MPPGKADYICTAVKAGTASVPASSRLVALCHPWAEAAILR